MSYSLDSRVFSDEGNINYLYINGNQLPETLHDTSSASGVVRSTGGRVVTLEASAGDKIEIRVTDMNGSYYHIHFCAEFIPKM